MGLPRLLDQGSPAVVARCYGDGMPTTTITPVVVEIPQWLARREGLASRRMVGEVLAVSKGGIRFAGHADASPSDHCHRCGLQINNPASLLVGYGPDCSAILGIPRNFSEEQLDEVRAQIESVVWEGWLPKRFITVTGADGNVVDIDEPVVGKIVGEYNTTLAPVETVAQVTFRTSPKGIAVTFPYNPRMVELVKSINGRRWDKPNKQWTVPASADTARALLDVFSAYTIDRDAGFEALLEQAVVRDRAQDHKTSDTIGDIPLVKTEPWDHQKRAFHFAKDLDATLLALAMGTGKTKVTIDLIVNRGHKRVLVICPKSVVGVWPREFERHAAVTYATVSPRKGTIAKRTEIIEDAIKFVTAPLVVVTNFESAWRSPLAELLLNTQWDCVVIDESHRAKAPGGKASTFIAKLGRRAAHRLALTGTPMPHSPLDIYAQFRFLDPGTFGTSFARFRSRYAITGGYGGHEILGYQHQDELAEKMYRIGFRVEADEVLDLPPALHITRTCELEPAARKVYNALSTNLFAEVEDGTVTAANALVRLLRLAQVTSGYAPVEDPDGNVEPVRISSAKEDLLADVLADLPIDEPVIVVTRFTHDLDAVRAVCEKQGRRYGELSGRNRDGLTHDAEMSPDIDVIGVNIAAGGVGIDLTRAHYMILFSVGFNLGDYEQVLARTHRPGQNHPVEYITLDVEDSVDQKVTQALAERKNVVEYVLGLAS